MAELENGDVATPPRSHTPEANTAEEVADEELFGAGADSSGQQPQRPSLFDDDDDGDEEEDEADSHSGSSGEQSP